MRGTCKVTWLGAWITYLLGGTEELGTINVSQVAGQDGARGSVKVKSLQPLALVPPVLVS